jgi:hypothetical protein
LDDLSKTLKRPDLPLPYYRAAENEGIEVQDRKMEKGHPSILGFYKERQGPEELFAPIRGYSSGLYVEIPTHLRNRLEVVVGSRFVGKLSRVIKENGEMRDIQAEGIFDVKGYWNEMHLPKEMVRQYELKKGDSVEIILHQIINHGDTMDV